jgi:hypothetical protein
MSKLKIATHLLLLLFYSCTQVQNDDVIYVNASQAEDFSVLIQDRLIGREEGKIQIEFEKGTYHFYPDQAVEKYMKISNNDNGNKKLAFPLFDYAKVEMEGNGSDFIFHGGMIPFGISGVEGVHMKNFNVWWDQPFTFEGEVIANDSVQRTFTIKVNKENQYEIIDNELLFKGYDWSLKLGENIVYNKELKRPYYYTAKYEHNWHDHPLKAKETSPGVVQFSNFSGAEAPPVGSVWVDKGPHGQNRRYPGFSVQDSKNVVLENINVYACGAMALIAEKSEDITLRNFNVKLPEGSSRMIGASADATHFVNCKGLITLEGCQFENMLDDAANVHGAYMAIDEIMSGKKIRCSFMHYQQNGFDFGSRGDEVRFVSRADLLPIQNNVIAEVLKLSDETYEITFMNEIGPEVTVFSAIENITYMAGLKMVNCTVKQNRARSILISTSKKVEVLDNYFSSMMAGVRICGDANYWFESGPVQEVVIRGNTFEDLAIGGHNPQAILQIDPIIGKKYRNNGYFHRNIVFEENTIKAFDPLIIYALSVDGLIIRNNTIVKTNTYHEIFSDLSQIDIQNSKSVIIENNVYNGKGLAKISIKDCEDVRIGDQAGFSTKIVEMPNKYFYQN